MGEKEIILKKLIEFGREISSEISVQTILFFGSRATGKAHRDSDIDLLIVSKDFGKMKPFRRAVQLYDYWNLDYPVDFLCLTPREFSKKKKQIGTIQQAVKEGILIKAG